MHCHRNPFTEIAGILFGVVPSKVQMVVNGVNKTCSLVFKDSPIFVRFSPSSAHQRSDLIDEVKILRQLQQADIPACRIFAFNNEDIQGPYVVSGIKYNALITEALGGPDLEINPDNARKFGHSLANLHSIPSKMEIRRRRSFSFEGLDKDFVVLIEKFNNFITNHPNKHSEHVLCHGDACLRNSKQCGDNVAFFDFEDAHVGDPVFDIGTFCWSLLDEEEPEKIFNAFLQGYQSILKMEIDPIRLKNNLARKEVHNLYFLGKHVSLTSEIRSDVLAFSQSILERIQRDSNNVFLPLSP